MRGPQDEPDLFGEVVVRKYPDVPGFKGAPTSRDAGRRISRHAATVRDLVLTEFRAAYPRGLGADEIAARLNQSILTVRPRCSELLAAGLIEQTHQRRRNASGMSAAIWRATPLQKDNHDAIRSVA
jgi:hypothetical protein